MLKKIGRKYLRICSENGSVTHVNNSGMKAIYGKLYSYFSLSTQCNNSKYTCTHIVSTATLEMTLKSKVFEPMNSKDDNHARVLRKLILKSWIKNKRNRDDNSNEIPRFSERRGEVWWGVVRI